MKNLLHSLNRPTRITAFYLTLLYGLAILLRNEPQFIVHEAVRIGSLTLGLVLPHLVGVWTKKLQPRPANLLITLLILALLAHPTTPPGLMVLLGLTTTLGKTLLRIQRHPVFNPAAAGLFAASFFGVWPTWWGVSFSPRFTSLNISIAMLLTVPVGLYVIWRYQKLPTLIGTAGALVVAYFYLYKTVPVYIITEGTFAFFLFIMATEPKTTPVVDWQEWVFGILLGAFLAWLLFWGTPMPYLTSLLGLNLLFSVFKFFEVKWTLRSTKPHPAS
ncbi:RnfABCDGE type electron transport complex subunit D [Patescibacteria group bacterium]|nr:RnfABCDGE type electron transport complex subunit D [Patescibacteria group bacterium]